jgi:hypothetical protein
MGNGKPWVNLDPIAGRYAASDERIIAVSAPDGTGCLVSVRCETGDGQALRVEVYRADPGVYVYGPTGEGN